MTDIEVTLDNNIGENALSRDCLLSSLKLSPPNNVSGNDAVALSIGVSLNSIIYLESRYGMNAR